MSTAAAQSRRNGVDTARLFATLDAVKAQPEAARFRFSVENRWISGTHNRNQISTFCGMGAEKQHASTFAVEADHRPVLVGGDAAPTPTEILLAALASCLTSGLGNTAAGDPQGRHRQRATDRPDHAGSPAQPLLLRVGQPRHQRGHHVHAQQARTDRRCYHHAPAGRQIRHIDSGSPPTPS